MSFWLVQRLNKARPGNGKPGFDSHFELDYMGSAEYEFRMPFESLQQMRKQELVIVTKPVFSCRGAELPKPRSVHFVGPRGAMVPRLDAWDKWLEDPKCKESTYFPENLVGLDWKGEPIGDWYKKAVAWWSFSDDLAWTLDRDVADVLLVAFQPKVVV